MKISTNKTVARALLRDEATCAFACMRAVDTLLGGQWLIWEPETLWMELSREGAPVPVGNRDQIMAGRNILTTGRIFYDAVVLDKTAVSFNNDAPNFEALDDAPVEYITWTVEETSRLNKFYREESFDFDREPTEYIALQLYRNGFVVAPEQLHWVQPRLDRHLGKHVQKLQEQVRVAAASKTHPLDETPVGVQLARLTAVQAHFDAKNKQLLSDLAKLG